MNGFLDTAAAQPKPAFWYGLPHGYLQLDINPTAEGLDEVARQISELPEEPRHRADQVFRLYAIVVLMLQKHQVQACALGMHPNDNGDLTMSVLTVSTVPTPGGNPKAALTKMLTSDAGGGADNGIQPVELPIGTGFLMESERRTAAPGVPPEGQEGPLEGTVWQGTVAIPDSRSSSVITVQLVTASLDLAEDYRGVLLGVARTISFTDPEEPAEAQTAGSGLFATSGFASEERSPFG